LIWIILKKDFPEFISLLARKYKEVDGEEELLEAFKVFDKSGSGFIMGQELSITLKALGEKFSDEEMDELI
jgi:calmodulin